MTVAAATSSMLKGRPLTPSGEELRIYSGSAHPLGATVDDEGVNFSIYSANATSVQLLLFRDPGDLEPFRVIDLNVVGNKSFFLWHVYVEGLKPGVGYAYRVDGPRDPRNGHRFDPEKVLVDPYSKGNYLGLWDRGAACRPGDNLHQSIRGVVIDTRGYDWEGDQPLRRPMAETVIYEMHVGGFTKSPTSGVQHPGTFKGLVEKIPYLKELGVTAVELLPVFSFDCTDVIKEFEGNKLVNYWGYSTMGYFAPHQAYCINPQTGSHVNEFRDMVKALHKAGIEVILDVVFNHTDEGNHQGPMFSFKGLDNNTYYYLTGPDGSREFYYDYTGCGNTFNCNHPIGEKFILDCLRYWVQEMHVDGGASTQVFLYPSAAAARAKEIGVKRITDRQAYIIRNARLDVDWQQTERRTLSIAGRAISQLIQAQGLGDLYRIYNITQDDKVGFNLAYIGADFNYPHVEEFDTKYMQALFDYGYQRAKKGYEWNKYPPGYRKSIEADTEVKPELLNSPTPSKKKLK